MPNGSTNSDVTVVVPCFNYGRFLPEALHSLTAQRGGCPRVIVVDDGSTDPETHRVLDEVSGDVDVIRQANHGVGVACNAGLQKVGTRYAIVLSADDRLPPGALEALRATLDADPALGYCYGQVWFFGSHSGSLRFPPWDSWRLLFRNIVTGTALMRVEVLESTGGFDPSFDHYEDWELWIHALAHGWRGRQIAAPTLEWRRHADAKQYSDRPRYHQTRRLLRQKHAALYGDLDGIARISNIGLPERLLYRYVWWPRPWPAAAEQALYSLLWAGGSES